MSKIVLMGDSITEYMPYIYKGSIGNEEDEVKYFGVENIGVGSYMNYCWPRVDHENVDAYILLIGTNNISRPDCDYDERETLDDLVEKLKEFINMISATGTRLIVQSIYPTKYPIRIEDIKFVNASVKQYCEDNNIEYLNMYDLLKNEEELFNEEYSDDGIHPNVAGYTLIAEEITKKVNNKYCKKLIPEKK